MNRELFKSGPLRDGHYNDRQPQYSHVAPLRLRCGHRAMGVPLPCDNYCSTVTSYIFRKYPFICVSTVAFYQQVYCQASASPTLCSEFWVLKIQRRRVWGPQDLIEQLANVTLNVLREFPTRKISSANGISNVLCLPDEQPEWMDFWLRLRK